MSDELYADVVTLGGVVGDVVGLEVSPGWEPCWLPREENWERRMPGHTIEGQFASVLAAMLAGPEVREKAEVERSVGQSPRV
jgi:hypothetical protein